MCAYFSRADFLRGAAVRRLLALVAISITPFIHGCSAFTFFSNSSGVGIPPPTAARDYAIEIATGASNPEQPGHLMKAGLYLIASITHTNEKCHQFFEVLERYKQDTDFVQKVLTAGIAAGSPLLALAGSSTAADVARFTSQVAFASQTAGLAADVYAFSAFKEQLKDHVFQSMASYQQSKGIDLMLMDRVGVEFYDQNTTRFTLKINGVDRHINADRFRRFMESEDPDALLIARTVAVDYSSLCSLANMKKIVVDALSKTRTEVEASAPGSPPKTNTQPETNTEG